MNCPVNKEPEVLVDYCAGRLDARAGAEVKAHLAACAACSQFVISQSAAWNALDAYEAPPVSAGFDRKLWERIEEAERRRGFWAGWWAAAFRRPVLAFALAVVFIIGAVSLSFTRPAPPPPIQATLDAGRMERALDDLDMLQQLSKLANGDDQLTNFNWEDM